MRLKKSNHDRSHRAISCALTLLFVLLANTLRAEPVVFHLKGGDRIAGTVVSESTNSVVIATPWAKELTIPLNQIESREPQVVAAVPPAVTLPTTTTPPVVPTKKQAPPVMKPWKFDAKFGMDLIYGENDRRLYYGQMALTYTRPYESNPKQALRNTAEYRADYATTDNIESANRMYGSDKMDFDVGEHTFVYNLAGAGYDDVRLIDLQYEVGPGLGYHLLRRTNITANVEGGFSYQSQDRHDAPAINAAYARAAQDVTWKIFPQTTLSQRASVLTRVDLPQQLQLRLEANLAFALVKNISFNLTAIEMYDTRPVPGVAPNEFQLRSAIGLAF
jgi:hypothetical protein